ncbi:MAG: peptidoglycan-binding protein [Verrucomicrobiae bacterium]|nr:peptidoglycan-binding protein [Verrucomicrobiae bacterium]
MSNPNLTQKIKAIQKRLGLPADGIIGPMTLAKIEAALDKVLPQTEPEKKAPTSAALLTVSRTGLEQIAQFEISSDSYYQQHLSKPTWPKGQSGITIGIGYDVGYHTKAEIEKDWGAHLTKEAMNQLLQVCGLKGKAAADRLASVQSIRIQLKSAKEVFYQSTLPKYAALTRKAYPGVETLPADAQAMLLSLVFNRGTSMTGSHREEMKTIQTLIKKQDLKGIALQLRSMKRLWDKSTLAGLHKRRDKEADLIANARNTYSNSDLVHV